MKINLTWSKRRKKTISARVVNKILKVYLPWWLPREKGEEIANSFLEKEKRRQKRLSSDQFLKQRALVLNKKYFGGKIANFSIFWSERQKKSLFGNCDRQKKEIRISSRLKNAPLWVIDYLIVHELAHFLEIGHGKKFWELVNRYPKAERAKGFLQGAVYLSS